MADLTHHERGVNARAVALTDATSAEELRIDKIRSFCIARITDALHRTKGLPDIERLLAIGAACPYPAGRLPWLIWLEEMHRLTDGMEAAA